QWLMALSLLTLAWHGYCTWSVRKSHEAPLLPMIIFMFWLSYGIDLFWGDRVKKTLFAQQADVISINTLTDSMLLVLFGVLMIYAGSKLNLAKIWLPRRVPDIPESSSKWAYLRVLL